MDPEFFDDKEFFLQIFSACFELFVSKSRKFLYRIGRTIRLFYAGLWKYCDDSGRFLNDFVKIKAEIFPFDEDINQNDIKSFLKVLEKANKIYLYEVNGVLYGIIIKFLKHQRIDKPTPSKLPPPPETKFKEYLQSHSLSYSIETPAQEKLKEVKLSKEKLKEVKEEQKLFSPFFQNPSQNQKPKYEPGPQFCSACKKPMADSFDTWVCTECGMKKPKRIIKEAKHG